MRLSLTVGTTRALITLDSQAAAVTCAALAGILPVSTTAHYAKVAGQEIYAHLPLIVEPEGTRAVESLDRGTVAFWPERQLFCVYYGRIQEEDASVTLLGRVTENLRALQEAGESLRQSQGRRFVPLRLEWAESVAMSNRQVSISRPAPAHATGRGSRIRAASSAMADAVPRDVEALLARHGVMRPAGVLFYAEAETRKLHEVLWMVRRHLRDAGAVPVFVPSLLLHFANRLGGWCGLTEAATLVEGVAAGLSKAPPEDAVDAVEALIIYAGRLNMWIDACIPWGEVNGLLQAAYGRPDLR
jgi:hypothetical protein